MLFQQFVDDDLGCASYLIGDEEAGVAAIVDPPYAIEPVLAEAARREVRIVRTIETHTHADHLSGHGRLALEHGLPISIHPAAEAAYEHDVLEDGAEIALGAVVLRAIHTPGHRPEHTCIAVVDRSRADEPWLVLTGDSLFVGDAARPDLAVGAQEGAEQLFHSLRRLLELPDGVEVFPGHVAGSLCGKAMSSKGSSTIGFERRFNHALQIEHEADFVADSASVSAPKPPNMNRLVELNRGPHVGAAAEVVELPVAPAGATVLDVRPARAYLDGHGHGALNVPVTGTSFATKAAFLLDASAPIVIQAASAAEAERAVSGPPLGRLPRARGLRARRRPRADRGSRPRRARRAAEGGSRADRRPRARRARRRLHRGQPQHPVPAAARSRAPTSPPTARSSRSARAAPAPPSRPRSSPRAGSTPGPVLDGGVTAWAAQGGQMVEFRRCGS